MRTSDDEEALASRVLSVEHRILVDAVRWFCEDLGGRRFVITRREKVSENSAGEEKSNTRNPGEAGV